MNELRKIDLVAFDYIIVDAILYTPREWRLSELFLFALFPAWDMYQIFHERLENGLQTGVPDTSFKISHHIPRRLNEVPLIFWKVSQQFCQLLLNIKEKLLAFLINPEFFFFNLHWQILSTVAGVTTHYCLKWCWLPSQHRGSWYWDNQCMCSNPSSPGMNGGL